MRVVDFNVEALHRHQMWYVLTEAYEDEFELGRPTPTGIAPYTKASAYRMFNQRVLLGFDDLLDAHSQNGLVAISNGVTEYVSTQPYERIVRLCNIAPPNDDLGVFGFADSVPIVQENTDWRCDNGRYGPRAYQDMNGIAVNVASEKSVVLEYETIISVPGVAHIVYIRSTNYRNERDTFLNNATTQTVTATLPEMFVLLNEWSKVSQYPFENAEDIAQDANQFLNLIKFDEDYISDYPPMQIAKFIMGDTNARLRPINPLPINQELELFIRNRSAHLSLASLLSTNYGVWDLSDIAELEESSIKSNMLSLYKHFFQQDAPEEFSLSMYREHIKDKLPEGYGTYIESWLLVCDKAEEFRKQFLN